MTASPATGLREALRAERPAVGLWASIPSPLTAEAAADAGPDYVVVDQQHGAVDASLMLGMLQAISGAGVPALVRVGRNEPWVIGHVLDLGAAGVIVPMVDSGEEAARAVAACRYAPEGVRSHGVLRGAPEARPVCLVMVETARGLDACEAIAATPELDGIYVGPSDLALSLGRRPTRRVEHQPVLEGIARVRAACDAHDRIAGVHCLDPEDVPRFTAQGFGLVTAGGDLIHLKDALAGALATARER